MSRARVFEWYKRFSEGRESLKDDDRSGCPRTAVTDDNIEKVQDVIWKDRRLGVRALTEEVNLDRESVWRILRAEFEHEKGVCKNGSKSAVRWTKRTLQGIVFRPFAMHWEWTRFVEFDYYLWWNLDMYVWSGNQATINAVEVNIISKTKKSTHESFEVEDLLIVFFDIQGIVMVEWVPSSQTVNQQYNIEFLTKLRECVRRKQPELWRNGWILH